MLKLINWNEDKYINSYWENQYHQKLFTNVLDTWRPPLLYAPPDSPTHAEAQGPCFSMVCLRLPKVSDTLLKRWGFSILLTRLGSTPETDRCSNHKRRATIAAYQISFVCFAIGEKWRIITFNFVFEKSGIDFCSLKILSERRKDFLILCYLRNKIWCNFINVRQHFMSSQFTAQRRGIIHHIMPESYLKSMIKILCSRILYEMKQFIGWEMKNNDTESWGSIIIWGSFIIRKSFIHQLKEWTLGTSKCSMQLIYMQHITTYSVLFFLMKVQTPTYSLQGRLHNNLSIW